MNEEKRDGQQILTRVVNCDLSVVDWMEVISLEEFTLTTQPFIHSG